MQKINYNGIDKGFREIIKILNEKFYYTTACCEGHLSELKSPNQRIDQYLTFPHEYEFPILIPLHNDVGTKFNYSNKDKTKPYSIIYNNSCYYWFTQSKGTPQEKEQCRQQVMTNLLNWAKALPPRDLSYKYNCNWTVDGFGKKGGAYRMIAYTEKDDKNGINNELRQAIKSQKNINKYHKLVVKREWVNER